MSYFRYYNDPTGCFNNGYADFEYRKSQHQWGLGLGYPHEIAVYDGSTRPALIKRTVAIVVVDEDDYGRPVIEKWKIKKHYPLK